MIVKETVYGTRKDPFIRVTTETRIVGMQIHTRVVTLLRSHIDDGTPVEVHMPAAPVALA